MKILHLTQTPVAQDPRVLRELEAIRSLPGAEVIAFGAPAGGPPPVDVAGVEIRQFDLVSVRASRIPRPFRYFLVLCEINAKFLTRSLQVRPDVVHCHDTMVLPAGVMAKALGRAGSLVYDAHELESAKAGQSRALSKATLLIERVSWRSVDALISVSPSIVNWYHQHLDRDRDLKPALCLVNAPRFKRQRGHVVPSVELSLRAQLGIGKDKPLFVFVGALVGGRGIDLILQAMRHAPDDTHVAFIGYGPMEDRIREASRENDNVHLCGPVPHDALVPFIQEADGALCLIEDVSLSDHYCLPNKLFEYAFAGVPIVASRLPDIADLVSRFRLGTCIDMNPEAVLEALERCLADGASFQPRDIQQFGWEAQGDNLRQFYLERVLPTDLEAHLQDEGAAANGVVC